MADPTVTPIFGVPAPKSTPPIASAPKYEEQDPKHQGAAGVARDILGTLGDFLLTRLHMPAMYGPAQDKRRLASAMEGFDTDPSAAISRVTSLDPVLGSKLRDQTIDNARLAASQASTQEMRDARLAQAQTLQNDRTRSRVAAMLGTMSEWDDNKRSTKYADMRNQVLNYAKNNGLDLSTELPESFDPTSLDSFIDGSVPVGTQRAQRLTRERIDVQRDLGEGRIATTRRGQDVSSVDRRRGQDVTSEGQRIRAATTQRGQNLNYVNRQAAIGETGRHNRVREAQQQPGRVIRQGDSLFDAKTHKFIKKIN